VSFLQGVVFRVRGWMLGAEDFYWELWRRGFLKSSVRRCPLEGGQVRSLVRFTCLDAWRWRDFLVGVLFERAFWGRD